MQTKIEYLMSLADTCHHCHPRSGCILSGLKGKNMDEIFSHLSGMGEQALERICSYHEACPYRGRVPIYGFKAGKLNSGRADGRQAKR